MDERDSAPLADEARPGAIPNDQPAGGPTGPGDERAPAHPRESAEAPDEDEQGSPPGEDGSSG